MNVEKFVGNADELYDRLETLISGGNTIDHLVATTERAVYIIVWS
jgi:hypothetical protein